MPIAQEWDSFANPILSKLNTAFPAGVIAWRIASAQLGRYVIRKTKPVLQTTFHFAVGPHVAKINPAKCVMEIRCAQTIPVVVAAVAQVEVILRRFQEVVKVAKL